MALQSSRRWFDFLQSVGSNRVGLFGVTISGDSLKAELAYFKKGLSEQSIIIGNGELRFEARVPIEFQGLIKDTLFHSFEGKLCNSNYSN
jgi:hypothetical protein